MRAKLWGKYKGLSLRRFKPSLLLHLLPLAPKNQNSSYSFSKRVVESRAPHRPQHILAITCTACPPHPAPGNLSISWALPSSIPQMGRIPPPRRPNRARTSKLRPPRMLVTTIHNVPGHTTSSKQNSGTRSSMEDPEDGSLRWHRPCQYHGR